MKVYPVFQYAHYEGSELLCICSTKEKAKENIRTFREAEEKLMREVEDNTGTKRGSVPRDDFAWEEWEVQ